MIWLYALLSVLAVSLISFIGVVAFQHDEEKMKPLLLVLVSFAAGALLGDVFIHLLPELAAEGAFKLSTSLLILGGILAFFILEKFIQWHHCHIPNEHGHHAKPLAVINIVGDGLHNFIDGMVIGASYLISIPVGFATTIAVILHEIPQEIGDFGVLIHAGYTKAKALTMNFLSAITAIVGTAIVLLLQNYSTNVLHILTPLTIGGFIYIAGSDLIPELHKETKPLSSLVQLLSFIAGIAVMMALLVLEK